MAICDRCAMEPEQCTCDNDPRKLNEHLPNVPPRAVSRGWGDMSWLKGWRKRC
jgi:hypothetical protein